MDGHVWQNGDVVLLGDSLGFMLILSFLHLNAKLFTDLPVHVCRCLVVAVYVLSFSSGQPEIRWPMVSSKRPHSLHFGSTSGFLRMLCWYQHVRRRWSWATLIKPSVSALRPAPLSHLWVLSWSTSACFTCCGYLPWSGFNSHLDLSCCYLRDLKVVSAVKGLRKSLGVPFHT